MIVAGRWNFVGGYLANLDWMNVARGNCAAHLSGDTVPASDLPSVQLQISEERGVIGAVGAAHADRCDLAPHHRAEEGGFAASADQGHDLRGTKPGNSQNSWRDWAVVLVVEFCQNGHFIALYSYNRNIFS